MKRISRLRLWLLQQLFGDPPGERAWAIFSHNAFLCQMHIRQALALVDTDSESYADLAQADAIFEQALHEPAGTTRDYRPYYGALACAVREAEDYLERAECRSDGQVQALVRSGKNILWSR